MRNAVILCLAATLAPAAGGQPVFDATPNWVSTDTQVSTGAALVDLDRDGWPDLVVANGNDIYMQRLVVYYNNGDGTFPALPDWQSADPAYNGHLDVADVNGDGWPDVAVARLGNTGIVGTAARVYLNNAGTLSTSPDWESSEVANAFGVAFGDVDNDGRPDLAVATGWPYSDPDTYHNYVHVNVAGQLEQTASWQSADTNDYMNALWVDADDDGWLDLALSGVDNDTWIYRNLGGTLETSAGWHTTDNPGQFAIMMTAGDVDGDGRRDLFVTDNTQIFNGSGQFRQYSGLPGGFFSVTPTWSYYSSSHRHGSAVALADLDGDGCLDLATGAWWSSCRIFTNDGTGFGTSPDWTSDTDAVTEKIVFADVDKNGLRTVVETFAPAPPGARLFHLANQPIQEVVAISRNGVELTPVQYTFSREHGWVTVHPTAGDVEVEYTCSSRLDMAVTNWDSDEGNYLFRHQLVHMGDANCDGRVNAYDIDPFVLLVGDHAAYKLHWPDCDADASCDMNGDGAVNAYDIDGFVAAVGGGI